MTVSFAEELSFELAEVQEMLLQKNQAYGNAALDPVRVFSKAAPSAGLMIRIDDKLSRLARGEEAGEDTIKDLIGYLILLRMAKKKEGVAIGF